MVTHKLIALSLLEEERRGCAHCWWKDPLVGLVQLDMSNRHPNQCWGSGCRWEIAGVWPEVGRSMCDQRWDCGCSSTWSTLVYSHYYQWAWLLCGKWLEEKDLGCLVSGPVTRHHLYWRTRQLSIWYQSHSRRSSLASYKTGWITTGYFHIPWKNLRSFQWLCCRIQTKGLPGRGLLGAQ